MGRKGPSLQSSPDIFFFFKSRSTPSLPIQSASSWGIMGNCPAEGPQFEAPNFLFHFCLFQWWSQRSNYVATVMAICLACKESSAGRGRPRQKPGAACRLRSQHQSSEQEKRTIACSSGLMVLKLLEGLYVSIWEWNKTQQVYTSWLWRRFEIGIWLEPGLGEVVRNEA